MAYPDTIVNEIHVASGNTLLDLKSEADAFCANNPEYLGFFLHHVYKEYNKRRQIFDSSNNMITPYDGGLIPYSYVPASSNLLLEDSTFLLLEDNTPFLLE